MQNFKTILTMLIILLILGKFSQNIYATNDNTLNIFPKISAESYLVMDTSTNDVLFSQKEKITYEPASLTKIMTAIIVLENAPNLQENVTIGENPPKTEPSSIYLVKDEIINVESLLYATLLQSANDAAVALAEHVGGSVENFSKMMNDKAKELGCTDTNFVNPSGLHDRNHYSNAKDMALILSYATNNETFLKISQTQEYSIPQTNLGPERELYNQSRILLQQNENFYDKAICAKTGYTDAAEHTFAAAAKDGQRTLVAVFLKDKEKGYNLYTKDCFEYAFNNYSNSNVFNKGDFVLNLNIKGTFVPLIINDDVKVTIKNGANIEKDISSINLLTPNRYTYLKDEEIATAKLTVNGRETTITLLSQNDITLSAPVNSIDDDIVNSTENPLVSNKNFISFLSREPSNIVIISVFATCILICILIILLFSYVRYKNYNYRRRRRRR